MITQAIAKCNYIKCCYNPNMTYLPDAQNVSTNYIVTYVCKYILHAYVLDIHQNAVRGRVNI